MSKSDIQYHGDHSHGEKYSRAAEHGVGGICVCHFKSAIKGGFTERVAFE